MGDEVCTVMITESCRGRFKLGIDGPPSIEVHREEIARRIASFEQVLDRRAEAAIANGKRPARIPS